MVFFILLPCTKTVGRLIAKEMKRSIFTIYQCTFCLWCWNTWFVAGGFWLS